MSSVPPKMSAPLEGPSAPQKKSNANSVLLTVIVVVCSICCLGGLLVLGFLFPVFREARNAARGAMRRGVCIANLHSLQATILIYAADNNDTFPRANVWMDGIEPLGTSDRMLRCPEARQVNRSYFGYSFNENLSSKKQSSIEHSIWLLGDSANTSRNAHSKILEAPKPGRHPFGKSRFNNLIRLDGSTKMTLSN